MPKLMCTHTVVSPPNMFKCPPNMPHPAINLMDPSKRNCETRLYQTMSIMSSSSLHVSSLSDARLHAQASEFRECQAVVRRGGEWFVGLGAASCPIGATQTAHIQSSIEYSCSTGIAGGCMYLPSLFGGVRRLFCACRTRKSEDEAESTAPHHMHVLKPHVPSSLLETKTLSSSSSTTIPYSVLRALPCPALLCTT